MSTSSLGHIPKLPPNLSNAKTTAQVSPAGQLIPVRVFICVKLSCKTDMSDYCCSHTKSATAGGCVCSIHYPWIQPKLLTFALWLCVFTPSRDTHVRPWTHVCGLPVVPALEQQQRQEDPNSKIILSYKVNSGLVLDK